jgi:hypothetical protein
MGLIVNKTNVIDTNHQLATNKQQGCGQSSPLDTTHN